MVVWGYFDDKINSLYPHLGVYLAIDKRRMMFKKQYVLVMSTMTMILARF
jgi:hypothetical protein